MGEEHNHEGEQQRVQDLEFPEKEKMSNETATGEEKKDIIMLKVYMHCEACARKVVKSLKGFPGVEEVIADSNEGVVLVKGKEADPVKVLHRVQEKCQRKVELISPQPQPPPPLNDEKKEDDKEPPAPTTIVLNVQMHCEDCARVIRKKLQKIKGVESARTDVLNNQVAVTGIVDPNELVHQVYMKTKKKATLVPPPPEETENKKDGEEIKKDGESANNNIPGGESQNKDEDKMQEDVKRNQIWPTRNYIDYRYHYAYAYPPPPQIFSDENPNACFIM